MPALNPALLFRGTSTPAYRGADRRGIAERLANPGTRNLSLAAGLTVLAAPLLGVGVLSVVPGLPASAVSLGAADVALVAFFAAALVLLVRWRLVGEAASVPLAAMAAVAGLLFVPATNPVGPLPGYVAALQTTSIAVILGAGVIGLVLPQVDADLRPVMVVVLAVLGALVLAIPLAYTPFAAAVERPGIGFTVLSAFEGLACAVMAVALLGRGVHSHNLVFAAAGSALLALAAACAALAARPWAGAGPWSALPALFVLVGGCQLLLAAGSDLRSAFRVVVLHDMRGRRRWAAAESELDRVRSVYRGQSHDVTSILSAVDGTLMTLASQGAQLSAERSVQLLDAIRAQIQQLTTLLTDDQASPGAYDLSELLGGIVALHTSNALVVELAAEPGLEVPGHPDRMLRLVNNLLVNAARHAPLARVTVSARRIPLSPAGDLVELVIADDGPGLSDTELSRAFEPGWRSETAGPVGGSGLGLAQCRQLAESEGGEIELRPTHPTRPAGARGLTAQVQLPARGRARSDLSSSILQMRRQPDPGINGEVVPGPIPTAVS
ncbi:MAG TPA: ATP-binding protein [Candidatus Dormibacteraeota bacterium]